MYKINKEIIMILTITGHRPERLKGQEALVKKWAR